PRELLEASRAGASHIKLFPASLVGPRYIREVLAPLPFLRLVPSGGVSLDNTGEWIRAGAIAVSVGSALVSPSLVAEQAWDRLPDNAIGRAALHALQAEGVGTAWIALGAGSERMGIYFVEPGADIRASRVVYDRAGSAFAAVAPGTVNWPTALQGAAWFHGSG